ncbi:YtfJ family protein [Zhongshania aquimaris]|uniref:YtfJ family protein n=1 Tax=Zhongshania aquimaris TaxID=2857107 RepID=A0ABS6VNP5_9GAMM|nr:YtfJ family protein [Zhongshania aquimaris]MBW2939400.1 YtfJ family protein [Zhongshania aquimaris]
MISFKNIVLSLSLVTSTALCNAIEIGGTLPDFSVPTKGELIIDGSKIQHKPWSTQQITEGTPALVFHVAARMSSDAIIAPLKERLNAKDYEPGSFQSISVINLNDALWGTAGFVGSELEKNKREHPKAILVADDKGSGIAAWELQKGTVAFILVDSKGVIRYLKQGKLTQSDIDTIITMLDEEIAKSKS